MVSQFAVADGAFKGLTQKDGEEVVCAQSLVGRRGTKGKEGGPAGGNTALFEALPPLAFSEVSEPIKCLVSTRGITNSTRHDRTPSARQTMSDSAQAGGQQVIERRQVSLRQPKKQV